MGYSWTYEVDDWVHQDQIYTFGYCACPNFVEEPMGKSVCPLEAITWDEIKKTLTHESQIERWGVCPCEWMKESTDFPYTDCEGEGEG